MPYSNRTTNSPEKILAEINQDTGELRTTILQKLYFSIIDYLLLNHNLDGQQYLGMCCFNVSNFSHTINEQINDLYKS